MKRTVWIKPISGQKVLQAFKKIILGVWIFQSEGAPDEVWSRRGLHDTKFIMYRFNFVMYHFAIGYSTLTVP